MARWAGGIVEQVEHALRGATTEIANGLVHGGETERLGDGVTVEADHRELSGHVDTQFTGNLEHPEGHLVRQTEHRSRTTLRRHSEHLPRCCCAALDGVSATEFDGRFKTSLRHDPPKPLEPKSGHRGEPVTDAPASDGGEAPMAEPDKVLGGKRATEFVIDAEGVFAVNALTDDHDRTLAPRPLPRGTEERIDHHDAVDSLVEVGGPGDEVASTAGGTQCAYEQILVGRLQDVLQASRDLADVPRVQMSGDEPDGLRSTRSQT